MIRLIVGLGNPGAEYEDTRHNAGFWWVDAAVRQLGGQLVHDPKYHGFVARVNRPEGPVWLLQPLTYMNLSGKAVASQASAPSAAQSAAQRADGKGAGGHAVALPPCKPCGAGCGRHAGARRVTIQTALSFTPSIPSPRVRLRPRAVRARGGACP